MRRGLRLRCGLDLNSLQLRTDGPPLRILVVEDFPPMLEAWVDTLTGAGYEVQGVSDGQSGIGSLRRARYDAVLSEYRMEGVTGLDVLEATRSYAPGTPFVLLSAMTTEALVHEALARGAFAVLAKPLLISELLNTVADALETVRGAS